MIDLEKTMNTHCKMKTFNNSLPKNKEINHP